MPGTQKTEGLYTLEEAQDHIADVRGVTDLLQENHPLGDSQVPNTPGAGNGSSLYSVSGTAQHMTESGLTGALPLGSANINNITVTQTTAQALSRTYTIPAGDANVGTLYRITAFGNGQWGSTGQAFAFGVGFPGTTEMFTHQAINSGAFGTSASFRWMAVAVLICQTTGNTGTWNSGLMLNISETANSVGLFTNITQSLGAAGCTNADVTQDTTISNDYCIIGWWGSATGSPTITTRSTIFERVST